VFFVLFLFFVFVIVFVFAINLSPKRVNLVDQLKEELTPIFPMLKPLCPTSLFVGLFFIVIVALLGQTVSTSRVVIIIGLYWTVGPGRQPPELYPVNLRRP